MAGGSWTGMEEASEGLQVEGLQRETHFLLAAVGSSNKGHVPRPWLAPAGRARKIHAVPGPIRTPRPVHYLVTRGPRGEAQTQPMCPVPFARHLRGFLVPGRTPPTHLSGELASPAFLVFFLTQQEKLKWIHIPAPECYMRLNIGVVAPKPWKGRAECRNASELNAPPLAGEKAAVALLLLNQESEFFRR